MVMYQYLTDLRLRRAKHLLPTTDLPLDRVAGRLGYGLALAF